MTLKELLEDVKVLASAGPLDRPVRGISADSRRVAAGEVFFALRPRARDGDAFARQAVERGAVAVVGERGISSAAATTVEVEEPRLALAQAADRWNGRPSRALTVVAVTGTNGKTTTTYLLEAVFEAVERRAGVIGTTGARIDGEPRPLAFTTPESPELQSLLREMVERRVQAVAIEVSSHALVQRRAYGLDCDVAVFTNLSHDHLDYHGTLEAYLDAKLMLFDGRNLARPSKTATAVVNLDDAAAPKVLEAARRGGLAARTFGASPEAEVRITHAEPRPAGLSVSLAHPGGEVGIELPLLGRHNAWNAAGAFAAGLSLGLPAGAVAVGLSRTRPVPGRLERVERGQPFEVVVDYAHTPDALERALDAVREHTSGRVLLVFGCGGDRDRAKRPVMGRVAAERADLAWVTSDNPRSEEPAAIAAQILAGAPGAANLALELDRRAAIAAALAAARPRDAVLIAGKGHETTQTIGERVLPFDDRLVAAERLESLAGGAR